MDQDDDHDGLFVVSVDELGNSGLWASVRSLLESRCTLHNLTLHNKVGRAVPVERLSLQFVPSGDKRLQRLRPFAHSPVVWFRHPYAHLLLVSTADASDYRNVVKPSLKRAIADLERDWGGPPAPGPPPPQPSGMGALLGGGASAPPAVGVLGAEWLIVYVRPVELDVADKAARKVYEKLKDDFGGRGRTRVLRIDLARGYPTLAMGPGAFGAARGGVTHGSAAGFGAGMPPSMGSSAFTGLDELEACLQDCVRNSFDARQAAYMAEVQRLANERRDPNWSFASLYLVKDSLALLLEGCGLHVDAYKEYVELEAAYQETLERRSPSSGSGPEATGGDGGASDGGDAYGACGEGAEVATLTSASWRATRRSILKQAAVHEFQFRQYLFASQARLLLRLGRPVDVAERGLRFIAATASQLGQRERMPHGGVRPMFKEAWAFTACLAVISSVTASVYGRDAVGGGHPPGAPAWHAAGPAGTDPAGSPAGWDAAGAAAARTRAARATSSPYGPGQPPPSPASLRAGRSNTAAAFPDVDDDGSETASGLGPGNAAPMVAAQQASVATDSAADSEQVDWQLWLPFEAEVPSLDPSALCGQAIAPASLSASRPSVEDPEAPLRQATFQAYMLALAHLYATAGSALLALAARAVELTSEHGGSAAGEGSSAAAGGEGSTNTDEWASALHAWRDKLRDLPSQYPCRGVVGMFVDQEEDRQFEATPQQQGTPLQLLRQAVSAMHAAAGDGGTAFAGQAAQQYSQGATVTPRGEAAAIHAIWLTPPSMQMEPSFGFSQQHRAESMYSVSMSAAVTSSGAAPAAAGGGDASEPPGWGPLRPGSSSGTAVPGHRPQVSWAAEPEVLNQGLGLGQGLGQGPSGPGARGRHQHSSSADNASSSIFSKLDAYPRPAASALEPFRPQRSGPHGQGPPRAPGLPSPHATESPVDTARSGASGAAEPLQPQGPLDGATSATDSAASSAAALLPAELSWLRDKRLRLALSSPRHCADLALHLALAAAACFSRAGRQRAAAHVFSDVGSVLLQRGQDEVVAGLMEHVVALAQAEGWHALLGRALPVLMAAQQAIGHVMLPYTCIGYLSLPARLCQSEMRRRVLELMLSTAGCTSPAPGHRLSPPASAVLQLATEQAVLAALLPGSTSKFYGTQASDGLPSLVPPARRAPPPPSHAAAGRSPPSADGASSGLLSPAGADDAAAAGTAAQGAAAKTATHGSAQLLRVGDVCTLQLQVYSNLPAAVRLRDMHLVLGTLQVPHQALTQHHHHHHQQQARTGPRAQAAMAAMAQRPSSFTHSRPSLSQPQPELPQQQQLLLMQQPGPQQQLTAPPQGPAPPLPPPHAHHRNLSGGDVPASAAAAAALQGWRPQAGPQGGASLPALSQAAPPGAWQGGADLVASQPFPGWDPRLQQLAPPAQHQQQLGSAPALAHSSTAASVHTAGSAGHFSPSSMAGAGVPGFGVGPPAVSGTSRLAPLRPAPGEAAVMSNASSALSLAPVAAGAAAASYGNLSDGSGIGRRAPSWPDALSAAASMTQPQGQGPAANPGSAPGFAPPPPPVAVAAGAAAVATAASADGRPSRSAQELAAGGPLSPASTQGGAAPGWLAGEDLACHHLVEAAHVQGPVGDAGRSGAAGAQPRPTTPAPTFSADPRTVVLQPGLTRLTFRVAPTKPGLYFFRHVAASLGSYDLRIPVVSAQQLEADIRALSGGFGSLACRHSAAVGPNGAASGKAGAFAFGGLGLGGTAGGTAAALAALGQVADGEVRHLDVALQVAPLLPRLRVAPVAAGGALTAGLPQWLGVLLQPLGDAGAGCSKDEADVGADVGAAGGLARGCCGGRGSGGDGLLHARVHVQARTPSSLRIGEWPPPPLHTPVAPLSAMQSFSGPPHASTTLDSSGPDPQLPASGPCLSAFANTTTAAAAAAAATAVHPSLASAQSYRRNDAAGGCRVAVVDLRKAQVTDGEAVRGPHGVGGPGSSGGAPHAPLGHGGAAGGAATCSAASFGGGGGADSAGGGAGGVCWALNSSRHGIDLSQALGEPLRSPVLVWLPVWVPPVAPGSDEGPALSAPPEVVRVQQSHAGVASSRSPAAGPASRRPTGRAYHQPGLSSAVMHGPGAGRGALPGPQPSIGWSGGAAGQQPLMSTELEVVVEGLHHGVWRSHASALSVPLQQPFQVRTSATQLPDARVLVSVSVTSNLLHPVVVTEVALEPQYGLVLGGSDGAPGQPLHAVAPAILPLRIAPGGTAACAFLLSRSEQAAPVVPSLHHDDCCILHMSYSLTPGAAGPLAADEAAAGGTPRLAGGLRFPLPPPAVTPQGSLPAIGEVSASADIPPASPGVWAAGGPPPPGGCVNVYSHTGAFGGGGGSYDAAGSGGGGGGGGASGGGLSFVHCFALEFPTSSALTHNLVSVRLLGPHTGVLGQPLHLTWLVTRVSAPPAALGAGSPAAAAAAAAAGGAGVDDGADVAVYEVADAAEGRGGAGGPLGLVPAGAPLAGGAGGCGEGRQWQWRQAVGCRGSVQLGRARGSVAVVEAVVVPLAAGLLQEPVLRLRGLKEVRDDDAGARDYIAVSGF